MKFRQLLFIFACLIVMILPAVNIDLGETSKKENRRLEAFPKQFHLKSMSSFFQQCEKAFNDRFFGRDKMIYLSGKIYRVFDRIGSGKAFAGPENWFFYRETLPGSSLQQKFSQERMKQIGIGLEQLDRYAKAHHKKFVFIVCPDKFRIYGDRTGLYPKEFLGKDNVTDEFVRYLREHYDFPVIYERRELLRLRDQKDYDLYYQYDTHWNTAGAYYGYYLPLMKTLSLEPLKPEMTFDYSSEGDLIKMVSSSLSEEDLTKQKVPVMHYPCPSVKICSLPEPYSDVVFHDMKVSENLNGNGLKLFCIRDSFTIAALDPLACTFSKARFIWRKHYELYETDRPFLEKSDVIVLEIVERELTKIPGIQINMELK